MPEPSDLVPVALGDDYYEGPHFTAPPCGFGLVVHVPRETLARWEHAFEAYGTAQDEIRELYNAAALKVIADHERKRGAAASRTTNQCYVTDTGVSVHVKPGYECD